MHLKKLSIYSFITFLFLVPIRFAEAGGFATARFGSEWGHVTADHPTSIYYNPAGMALGLGTRIFFEGIIAYRQASYERPAGAIGNVSDSQTGTPTDGIDANSGTGRLSNVLGSPFLGIVTDFGIEGLGVGAAFFVPFGGQASWQRNNNFIDSSRFPGAVDGAQRWATIEGSIRALYGSVGAAYRLKGPRLSFGTSFNVVKQDLNTIRARNATGTDDLVQPNGNVAEGRSLVNASATTMSIGAGVIWQPTRHSWLGFSYQSKPGFGETKLPGTLSNKLGVTAVDEVDVDFVHNLPDIFRLGGRIRPSSDIEFRLNGAYTRWSSYDNQCLVDNTNPDANCALGDNGELTEETVGAIVNIHRDWHDNFTIAAGMSYWPDEELELLVGGAFDSNAVPDETLDASLMDMNKFSATLGGRWNVGDSLKVNVTYSHVFYASRTVDLREPGAVFDPPSTVPDQAGTYTQSIGLLNLGAELSF